MRYSFENSLCKKPDLIGQDMSLHQVSCCAVESAIRYHRMIKHENTEVFIDRFKFDFFYIDL
jgi:hypothetical protein